MSSIDRSHESMSVRGSRGWVRVFSNPSSTAPSTRVSALSGVCSLRLSRISMTPALASGPSPSTKTGRPPSVSHHVPVRAPPAPSPNSSRPRRRLTTSVLDSPGVMFPPAADRRPRNPRTRSVHHGSNASCPPLRRLTSMGAAMCSAPANRHPSQPRRIAASIRTATPSPWVTSVPENGPSVGSSVLTTRCAPGTSGAPRPSSIAMSFISPSQRRRRFRHRVLRRPGRIPAEPPMCRRSERRPLRFARTSTSRGRRTR